MKTANQHSAEIGVRDTCAALAIHPATFYRHLGRKENPVSCTSRPRPPLALSKPEVQNVLDTLHSETYVDLPPQAVVAKLLDKGKYLCSWRTMYRILADNNEVRERRKMRKHIAYTKPELIATAPNQVWSWDITKLKGPVKWTYYYLYLILDIYSRYVVGWLIADREASSLAKLLIRQSCEKQGITPQTLTLHSDRGSSMKSKPVALLLADLGVTKSHSRPYTSNDNPYSEAQFKTAKYRPDFPDRFGCIQDSRVHFRAFHDWYNKSHYHSGIAMLSPESVHYGRANQILHERKATLEAAFRANPKRFKGRMPFPAQLPEAVWINKPKEPMDMKEIELERSV